MNILQINSASGFGGGEKHFIDLTFCLQTRGHQVFAAARPDAIWLRKLDFVTDKNVLRLSLTNAIDLQSAWQLASFIREKKIEIVHAHLARDYALAAVAARLSRLKPPLILTRHVLFPINRMHKLTLPKNTTFIAVSKAVRKSLLEQKLVRPEAVKLIYNGVDARYFTQAKRGFNRQTFLERIKLPVNCCIVGMVGEITAHKGQTDFVRAAARIIEQHSNTHFVVVGDDSSPGKKHRAELEDLIVKLKLQSRVHILGWVEDVAATLFSLDVFVSASRVEPFGLAITEAMAAGLPVVATMSEGAQEILVDGETGKLVPIGAAGQMADAINYFLENEEARKEFARRAQRAVRERFDLSRMIRETEQVYEEALQRAG